MPRFVPTSVNLDRRLRLVLLSFLMLFLELALIRWTGSNVFYLSYFSNFVLLGSFLGIGLGFLRGRSRADLFPWALPALAFMVAFVRIFPVEIARPGTQLLYFGTPPKTGLPIWVTLPIVFVAVALIMAMVGQGVARTFVTFEPLEAYRLDILGSIGGIVAFSGLAFLRAPPLVWGLVVGGVFLLLYQPAVTLLQGAAVLALLFMLGKESFTPGQSWSPYYRVSLVRFEPGILEIHVNGVPHQAIMSSDLRRRREPIYFAPYDRAAANPLRDVLIVGAGNGSDVAIALSNGARRVDAVEIDPRLYELGRALHPNRPYQSGRVSVHINDGRAFLERTDRRYDLILFALPDSITLVAGQSSLRLESYLFTREAIAEAKRHLRPHGAFAMYNFYRQQWLVDRLAGTLDEVFHRPPCVDSFGRRGHLSLLITSADPRALSCRATWRRSNVAPAPATDDHPFVYLRRPSVPGFYLLTILLILVASLALIRTSAGPLAEMRSYLDLLFMGAGFLLLETKNVVQFALLFGTTWLVNALVFAGILLSVFVAIQVARRVRFRQPLRLYAPLLLALAVAWAVPAHALLNVSLVPRFFLATAIAFAPVFIANLVFAERFRAVGSSDVAFGANLLGAMLGGLVEYSALVVGYRSLLIVAAGFYGLAFVFGRNALTARPEAVRELIPA